MRWLTAVNNTGFFLLKEWFLRAMITGQIPSFFAVQITRAASKIDTKDQFRKTLYHQQKSHLRDAYRSSG